MMIFKDQPQAQRIPPLKLQPGQIGTLESVEELNSRFSPGVSAIANGEPNELGTMAVFQVGILRKLLDLVSHAGRGSSRVHPQTIHESEDRCPGDNRCDGSMGDLRVY